MQFIEALCEIEGAAKPLFLDFHGTISDGRLWATLDREQFCAVQNALFEHRRDIVETWMLGGLSSEDVVSFLSEKTGISYSRLWSTLVESAEALMPNGEMIELINEASRHFDILILTENMDALQRFTFGPGVAIEGVRYVVSSSRTRCRKIQFLRTMSSSTKWSARPHPGLLIDDASNIVSFAESVGLPAMLTTSVCMTADLLREIVLGQANASEHAAAAGDLAA